MLLKYVVLQMRINHCLTIFRLIQIVLTAQVSGGFLSLCQYPWSMMLLTMMVYSPRIKEMLSVPYADLGMIFTILLDIT